MEWHGYILVEDVALTTAQRAAVLAAFNALGPVSDPHPARLLHRRVSLDGSQAIYEANFNADNLTVDNAKQFLANAVGVAVGIIDHVVAQTVYGPLVTYRVASVDRMQFLVFGEVGSTHDESRQQCLSYLQANVIDWDNGNI